MKMTNKEKFIEVMNRVFDAGFTEENFAPAKNGSCPALAFGPGICNPCGFYKEGACLNYTCNDCSNWWDEEYKERAENA